MSTISAGPQVDFVSAECVALDGQCGACFESNDAVLCSCITVVGPEDGIGTQFDIAITEDIDAESGAGGLLRQRGS
ncbi:MAG UNVERIFIED_CONTAM: hypothetical protein LVR18_35305 [Planctomycetaceae bacterium]|jgi:hypothetical protein